MWSIDTYMKGTEKTVPTETPGALGHRLYENDLQRREGHHGVCPEEGMECGGGRVGVWMLNTMNLPTSMIPCWVLNPLQQSKISKLHIPQQPPSLTQSKGGGRWAHSSLLQSKGSSSRKATDSAGVDSLLSHGMQVIILE